MNHYTGSILNNQYFMEYVSGRFFFFWLPWKLLKAGYVCLQGTVGQQHPLLTIGYLDAEKRCKLESFHKRWEVLYYQDFFM